MLRVAMVSVHTCPLARLGSRETGGMNVYIRELSRHLGARGVAVDVFTRRQAPDVPTVVDFGPNARVVHLEGGPDRPLDKYRVLDYLPQFVKNVRRFQEAEGLAYDVAHSHYWLSAPVAMELAAGWGVPMVAMFHTLGHAKNHVSRDGHERELLERIEIEEAAMRAADRLVAASPTDMQQIVSYYHADPTKVSMVPEGVDTNLFHPLDRQLSRSIVGMGDELQVLFVGRIQQLKGIDLLLRAFSGVVRSWTRGPLPRLTIVGGVRRASADPEEEELVRLQNLAKSLDVESLVTFRDAVSHYDLPPLYCAADAVVVPSSYESFGLVALEAMACGTPVVASRVGGLQWTIRDGETGFLVPHRTPEAFANALGIVLGDHEVRLRMSEAAVRTASKFSWDVVAERILALYEELLPCRCGKLVSSGE